MLMDPRCFLCLCKELILLQLPNEVAPDLYFEVHSLAISASGKQKYRPESATTTCNFKKTNKINRVSSKFIHLLHLGRVSHKFICELSNTKNIDYKQMS
ncbi:hypothetical protein AQUCO_00500318v1 [Aquilegia coerulea]|uniref:Uncharacterized protein n=1 Tax=Aquilegia coerulea TaxID=218851 RepID=A0A2G5ERD4_AQUCA|nr:hypothetical protein AQUCO_00500318v1 [Aquilegia coerulea]